MTRHPTKAILLAAGLGKRMRPITDHLPKPLVQVDGKPMLDHALDRLDAAGITDVVVNVHHLANQIESHLSARHRPNIIISDERNELLETGGGAKKALPHFNDEPFISMNSDCLWTESGINNLATMTSAWRHDDMDMLLMIVKQQDTLGYEGKGDFDVDAGGRLTRRASDSARCVYAGAAILKPELFVDTPDGPFSLNILFDRAIAKRRLFGHLLQGCWLHVGTPESIEPAQERYRALNR